MLDRLAVLSCFPSCSPHPVAHVSVTPNARYRCVRPSVSGSGMVDRFGDLRMAMVTCAFSHPAIALGNAKRVGIPAGGEVERVPDPVPALHHVFADDVMRRVTIVAGCDGMMAAFHPRGVVFAHDVAVGARCRIVGEYEAPRAYPKVKSPS